MTKEQRFKKEYARELIAVAGSDLEAARALHKAKIQRAENIFLFAQQCLEKGLKSILCWNNQSIPMIHDIGVLVTKVEALGLQTPFGYSLNSLTEYATIRRYLEGREAYNEAEITQLLQIVAVALDWCEKQIL